MQKYEVNYKDPNTGAVSPIDVVEGDGYTAEKYISDCEENADKEWIKMLRSGEVILTEIKD